MSARLLALSHSELMAQHEISASFHHSSRRHNPSCDTARVTIKKISLNPTNRRSSHALAGGAGRATNGQRTSGQVAQVFGTYSAEFGTHRSGETGT